MHPPTYSPFSSEIKKRTQEYQLHSWFATLNQRKLSLFQSPDLSSLLSFALKTALYFLHDCWKNTQFFINSLRTSYILRKWLTWLKDDCKLKATKFMVDCSVAETEALNQSFYAHDVYYCSFHVGQAWERKMRQLHDVSKEVVYFECYSILCSTLFLVFANAHYLFENP